MTRFYAKQNKIRNVKNLVNAHKSRLNIFDKQVFTIILVVLVESSMIWIDYKKQKFNLIHTIEFKKNFPIVFNLDLFGYLYLSKQYESKIKFKLKVTLI